MAETRYLKLKLSADLTADAKSNLLAIDALGAYTDRAEDGTLRLRSAENVLIEPQSNDIGGTGQQGTVSLGTSAHKDITVDAYTLAFKIRSALSLINAVSSTPVNPDFLKIAYSSVTGSGDRTLSLDLLNADRQLTVSDSGRVAVTDAAGSNANITQLTGLTTALSVSQGGTGQTTTTLATKALLEGATSETYAANQNQILGVNAAGTGIEWKTAGSGIVETISVSAPLTINNTVPAFPSLSLPSATSSQNGYLTSADWTTFNNKADALPGGGTAGTFLRGDNTWSVINTDNVSELAGATNKFFTDGRAQSAVVVQVLSSIDTTHSPSSSAVITQLGFKENTIAPGTTSQYWRGDKSWRTLNTDVVPEGTAQYFTAQRVRDAAIVQTVSSGDTTHSPSADAIKTYVDNSVSAGMSATDWTTGTSIEITHGFGTRDVMVSIYEKDAPYAELYVDKVERTDTTKVTLTASVAPPATGWRVLVRR